jgi:hypothetical protein
MGFFSLSYSPQHKITVIEDNTPKCKMYIHFKSIDGKDAFIDLCLALASCSSQIIEISTHDFGMFVYTNDISTLKNIAERMKKHNVFLKAEVEL